MNSTLEAIKIAGSWIAVFTPIVIGLILYIWKTEISGLKEKIQVETEVRQKEMESLKSDLDEQFSSLAETNILLNRLIEKLDNHIDTQKTICKMNHRK